MKKMISVIVPAWNEEACIAEVVRGIALSLSAVEHEIIVVNDGSSDATRAEAEKAGARVISHAVRRGYGASLKTGIRQANYDLIATMDGDGQHDAEDVPRLLALWDEGFDMVIGARDRDAFQYTARMPGKVMLQYFAEFLVGERPRDVNSGLRIFRREDAIRYFPILPNGFSFSTTITLAMLKDAYLIGWVPIQTTARIGRRSSVSIMRDGMQTGMLIIRIATLFNPLKVFLPISVTSFLLGFFYAALNLLREFNIPDGAALLMTTGVIIFFFGILADQFSSIRRP
jgi:glycosyltransferase involved in cell wall biosynthesis